MSLLRVTLFVIQTGGLVTAGCRIGWTRLAFHIGIPRPVFVFDFLDVLPLPLISRSCGAQTTHSNDVLLFIFPYKCNPNPHPEEKLKNMPSLDDPEYAHQRAMWWFGGAPAPPAPSWATYTFHIENGGDINLYSPPFHLPLDDGTFIVPLADGNFAQAHAPGPPQGHPQPGHAPGLGGHAPPQAAPVGHAGNAAAQHPQPPILQAQAPVPDGITVCTSSSSLWIWDY